jgi:anti-sigma factor RsiW
MATQPDCGADLGAYVLGALTDQEAGAFQRHVETCPACREEVALLQPAATALPLMVAQVEAPRRLRRRVMTEVRADAKQRARTTRMTRTPETTRTTRTPRMLRTTRPRWGFLGGPLPRPAMAGLGALLVAAVVAIAISSGSAGPRLYPAQTAWRTARAAVRIVNGRGELLVKGMPVPPAGKVYEVWLQRGHAAPHATKALFDVTSHGGAAAVAVPGDLSGVSALLVTAEPEGGSTHPTSQPVIVARLA